MRRALPLSFQEAQDHIPEQKRSYGYAQCESCAEYHSNPQTTPAARSLKQSD